MTYRSYFGKQNSTLGSVVPLSMFIYFVEKIIYLPVDKFFLSILSSEYNVASPTRVANDRTWV